jgi:hypothetical protein
MNMSVNNNTIIPTYPGVSAGSVEQAAATAVADAFARTGAVGANVTPGSLSQAIGAGTMPSRTATLTSAAYSDLVATLSAYSFSQLMNILATLMIEQQSEMRRESREGAVRDGQLALATANSAADDSLEAARKNMVIGVAMGAVTIAVAAKSMADTTIAEGSKQDLMTQKQDLQAGRMAERQAVLDRTPPPQPASPVSAFDEIQYQDDTKAFRMQQDHDLKGVDDKFNLKFEAIDDQIKGLDTQIKKSEKYLEIAKSVADMGTKGLEYSVAVDKASAEKKSALANYIRDLSSSDKEFAGMADDMIKGLLQMLKSLEASNQEARNFS